MQSHSKVRNNLEGTQGQNLSHNIRYLRDLTHCFIGNSSDATNRILDLREDMLTSRAKHYLAKPLNIIL